MSLWDVVGDVAGGVASAYGAWQANRGNRDIARETNQANRNMAREAMSFSERMSSTAWQRTMADMKKAGLNPIYALHQGPASSPGGTPATATTGAPQQDQVSPAVNSAINVMRTRAELQNMKEQNALLKAQAEMYSNSAKKILSEKDIIDSSKPKADFFGNLWDIAGRVSSSAASAGRTFERAFKTRWDKVHERRS